MEGEYNPIRAETSAENKGSLRYAIPDIPVGWELDKTDGRYDFNVIAFSEDGQIVENLSSSYLSFDESASTLTVAPVFGQKDFCVYVFRDEKAANLFAIKSDGNASLISILAQFEKDNRVLKQLQALQGRVLRTPNECAILPDVEFRKNKFLGFDADGNPNCALEYKDYENVRQYRDECKAARDDVLDKADEVSANADAVAIDAKQVADDKTEVLEAAAVVASKAAQVTADSAAAVEGKNRAIASAKAANDSKNAAAQSESNAAQSKADAETAAANASAKAAEAAQSATASANSAAQSATSAQSANAAKTAAETAAEVAQSTDAGQLMLSKTPQGFLDFIATGTTQAVLAKQTKLTKAFSLCFTFIAPDSVPSSLSSGTWLCYSMGDPTQAAQVGFVVQWTTWWDNKAQQGFLIGIKNKTDAAGSNNRLFLPYSTVSDGKPHAVAIIASPDSSVSTDGNNGKIRAYVDGVLQASTDAFVADTDKQNSRFTFSNTFGRLARMCRFNFDISAAAAPYTLADYTSGKAIPAALYAPFNFSADGSTWEPMKMSDNTTLAPATVSVADDVITITTTAEIGEAFFRIKPTTDIIKGVAGQTLHASIESFSGIGDSRGLGVKPMINDGEVGQINLTTNTKSGTWSMDRPFNSVNLTIRYGTSPIPSGTVFTITGLRVWTNGSVVALDDYTFGGKIRDISGNDNHATVSTTNGVRIHGDKDESVQQMYEAFSAQYTTDNP